MQRTRLDFKDDQTMADRIDSAAESLTKARGGRAYTRSDVIRDAIRAGLPLVMARACSACSHPDLAAPVGA